MPSPFRQHQQRVRAAMASGSAAPATLPEIDDSNPAAAEYRQLQAALHEDLRALHDVQSVQEKIARKGKLIDTYLPWVEGAIEAGKEGPAVQDEIVVTIMVWAIDVQAWPLALGIAEHVLKHGLALPERYKRTPACLIAEEVAEAAKADPKAVPYDVLTQTRELTDGYDMPDQAKAKLLRAIGLDLAAQAADFDPAAEDAMAGGKLALVTAARMALQDALRFDKHVGVKKQLEQLDRESKKLAEEAGEEQN